MDGGHSDLSINLVREFFTAETIVPLFEKYDVPAEFDLLVIDTDLMTYWILQALLGSYRPRVITVEFNRNLPPWEALAVEYEGHEKEMWGWGRKDYNCYFGASIYALHLLFESFGYHLLAQDSDAVNLFAVRDDETGRAPISYERVLANLPPRSQLCWDLHAPCPGKRWLRFPESGVDFEAPRGEWYGHAAPVTRADGKRVQIFTEFGIEREGAKVAARPGDPGRRLDKGCL